MSESSRRPRLSLPIAAPLIAFATVVALAGCGSLAAPASTMMSVDASSSASATSATSSADATSALWDTSAVHTVAITVDADALSAMISDYLSTGDKAWLTASVTIDGVTYDNVGIKLKGNSTLKGVTTSSDPAMLPWRIRLDKFVDGQNADGVSDFTVRANSSATSLNEAAALDGLTTVGLASEKAAATRFSVNGGGEVLRLSIQALDDAWVSENFPDAGDGSVLYKATADGSWDWLGADADYSDSFDIEAGADDEAPLIALLDLVNNGTADEIAQKLPTMLDVDAFATYLAFEDVIDNFDDISGPGNNAYLFWDSATQKFMVVAWDHNLAFGVQNTGGGAGGGGGAPGGGAPGAGQRGGGVGAGAGGGGAMSRDNPLVAAFEANSAWAQAIADQKTALEQSLVSSGALASSVERWAALLNAQAGDLVEPATVASEATAVLAAVQ
ncbi:CotH kinase family protein [Microbacterium sp. PM5]|uniref:CotH kinase family protein n=1 Tax=Microbacterium sp. PM5 TaxID=2014534 RepID=UPI000DD13324|nr:CotH kinase family protein [Microbacterium sp. PM5]AXA96900.1 hypothetical protein CEP17_11050 [Microbacterium sp. PM5]